MTPRKAKSFFPEIASEFDVPEETVEAIIDFFWKEIRKELTEPSHINVVVQNFGTFEARRGQLEYMRDKYKRIIRYMKPTTYNKHTLLNKAKENLERIEKLLELLRLQNEKRKQVREIQKNGKSI